VRDVFEEKKIGGKSAKNIKIAITLRIWHENSRFWSNSNARSEKNAYSMLLGTKSG
jgi:hypothetical protein